MVNWHLTFTSIGIMPVDYFWLLKEKKKPGNLNIAQATPDRKKNEIMAYLTDSVSGNNASLLSKTADKNLPILSNFILHVIRGQIWKTIIQG